ncbi:S1C family serine protease [Methylococcus capsulatus]|uniref:S1C family serine protease n=1 Tax=Methylococcus capsulatus TaxID=414 RepID=UPI001C52F1CB|nr:trypsin-like peptidase domain-containing protein [Methylococcus capsulatus]QXP87621.1 trypsin-like peptidase domain-containing protein [Methylococcus capsulatus]QXP92639.1 trypsin-like peptidase domain-containing protein [Methylococcus capsulatus]UQN12637.1 trypsin-like peptidase domain-containing protein [Methylococcus capsulatus]
MKPIQESLFPRRLWTATATLLLGFGMVAGGFQAASARDVAPRPISPRGELALEERATVELFEKSKNSVVYISTLQQVMDPWTRNVLSIPRGTGSGFIWDEAGHVVTNYHVVEGASGATVKLADGRDYRAALVGVSKAHDLAVLRIDVGQGIPSPLPIGVSHDLKVGQKVFAIGNPFGLDWSLTTGIVSALDRSLTEETGVTIEHLIQTDAAINPGNSGGPLLDSAGRLVGINTAIYSPSGAFSGVGFAVPVDTVNRVVPQLIGRGQYIRPALGIAVDEGLNQRAVQRLGVTGVLVLKVNPGSAAEAAGLKGATLLPDGRLIPGDIIVAVEGRPVDSVSKLSALLDDYQIGQKVRLSVRRGDTEMDIAVQLQAGN